MKLFDIYKQSVTEEFEKQAFEQQVKEKDNLRRKMRQIERAHALFEEVWPDLKRLGIEYEPFLKNYEDEDGLRFTKGSNEVRMQFVSNGKWRPNAAYIFDTWPVTTFVETIVENLLPETEAEIKKEIRLRAQQLEE